LNIKLEIESAKILFFFIIMTKWQKVFYKKISFYFLVNNFFYTFAARKNSGRNL